MRIEDVAGAIERSVAAAELPPTAVVSSSGTRSSVSLVGHMHGRGIRVEVTDESGPEEERYQVWVYDSATGEALGIGEGGPTVSAAAHSYPGRGVFRTSG